ncbi:HAD-IA family hydrolase [Thermoproteota archaeon]
MEKTDKHLVVDFYKTAVKGDKLDTFLAKYAQKDDKFYDAGGSRALSAIMKARETGDHKVVGELETAVKDLFFDGINGLHDHAKSRGYDVSVYSNGHPGFIKEAFKIKGMDVGTLDPNEVGSKKQAASYDKVCKKLGTSKDKIVYVTDSTAEVKAATDAGLTKVALFNPSAPSYARTKSYIR